jgi:hypothetical protein
MNLRFACLAMIMEYTANLIIIEGHETAFNGFKCQFTTGKPLKNLKPSIIMRMAVSRARLEGY